MAKNKFTFTSGLKEIEKELEKDQRRQVAKAARVLSKAVKSEITEKGIIDDGDLLKSVGFTAKKGVAIVGVGFPAHMIEKGTVDRVGKDGHSSGKMVANPFFLPAFKKAQSELISILTEEW